MSTAHKKFYAKLVGQVDEAITYLERMTKERTFDWFHTAQVTELLKAALLEAEEMYIEDAPEGPRLILLSPEEQR